MDIRKISVGSDYKSAMHYIVGQTVLNGSYNIHLIQEVDNEFKIWIEKDDEVMMWKLFSSTMPISVEYNINF
jgi:hypothetical protein|tara:strand:+ start:1304 stop:1519 length:216 start_codon:yes stop_codon:yes gene_type:complete